MASDRWVVGVQEQLTRGPNGPSPGTKYKRSKIALAAISILLKLGTSWDAIVTVSRAVSKR